MEYLDKNGEGWTQEEFNMLPRYFIEKMAIQRQVTHLKYIKE
jgi:hypothetical protein